MSEPSFYKNEYRFRKTASDFVNRNRVLREWIKPLVLEPFHAIEGYLPYPRNFLARRFPRGGVGCEVGVFTGEFSDRILKWGKPRELYLVDPWKFFEEEGYFGDKPSAKYQQAAQDERYRRVTTRFARAIAAGQVRVVRKTSVDAAADFPDGFFDYVYIDANHAYEHVKTDLEAYYPKLKSGGLLCGDDFHLEGVQRAVGEFVAARGLKIDDTRNRQFVIVKP